MSSSSSAPTEEEARALLYKNGLKIRNAVAGPSYVSTALANGSSDYARPMQEFVTQACWGSIWTRPGLDLKTRSLLNIAMLCALNRGNELGVHTRGALNNGASEVEVREVVMQAGCYCEFWFSFCFCWVGVGWGLLMACFFRWDAGWYGGVQGHGEGAE